MLVIVNHRNWLDDSPPLMTVKETRGKPQTNDYMAQTNN